MRTTIVPAFLLTLSASLLAQPILTAQETNLARTYTVSAKDGMLTEFETALREHAQWRAANDDPWSWSVYAFETGNDLSTYVIRSARHSWADFDAYDEAFAMQGLEHWTATVAPYVESVSSSIDMADYDDSRLPPEGTEIAFVTTVTYYLQPGMEQQFSEAMTEVSEILKAAEWPEYWVWVNPVSGGPPGPWMGLAFLYTSWSDMASPDPTFEAVMLDELGEEGFADWGERVGDAYVGLEVVTLRFRPDLSVIPD